MNDLKILKLVLVTIVIVTAVSPCFAVEYFLRAERITKAVPDGNDVPMWGFAADSSFGALDGQVSVPGPLLNVPVGDSNLTIHLDNNLSVPISIVINGQNAIMTPVRNPDGRVRSFTHETDPNNTTAVDYSWTSMRPGSYIYQSGTHPAVQVQMGLYGGVIKDYAAGQVYQNVPYTDNVTLFFSEIDPALHDAVDSNNYGPGQAMTSTIDYEPRYFMINGQMFEPNQPMVPAGTSGGGTLLRLFNMGLKTRSPLLQGAHMELIAEDGRPYRYPKEQYVVSLPAGKTIDVRVAFPSAGTYPIYDRRLGLTNNQATQGGMLTHLEAGAGNFWPVINSLTATPASIVDVQTSQLLVSATDTDGPSPLSYSWTLPPGAGSLNDPTIANPVYTPPFAAGTNTYTLTVTVSDGTNIDIGTIDVTVKGYLVPVINSVTAMPNPIFETQTSQLLVTATDPDGPSSLTYNWIVPAGAGNLSSASVANPTYTPPDVTGNQIFTLTVEVFDGITTVSDTVDITVQDGIVPTEVTIDNLDAETSSVGVWLPSAASGSWSSNSVWANDTGDSFTFTAALVPGATYNVYEWHTEYPSRNTSAPHEIRDGGTLLATVNVNQQANGGQWNLLGTYTFTGSGSVTVLASPGSSTNADAIRFTPVTTPVQVTVDNLDPTTSSVGVWLPSSALDFWATNSVWANDTGDSFAFTANVMPGTYDVYEWHSSWPSRNTAAPHEIRNGATLLDTVLVNQQLSGGQWNLLGTHTFTNTASVTVLASPGSSTVADAIRLVPVP